MAKSAEELLIYLFDEILPKYGMNLRVKQKELSLEMLRALQENKLALCEAEVGTGKTHAYILALTVHNIYSNRKAPAVISTSTIALQKALTEEYIPQISGILLEHHVIDKPLSFVVRKGKRHYVCDSRLKIYETSIKNLQREADAELILELARLGEQEFDRIDLDDAVLTPYVKGRINVFRCNKSCPYSLLCRFMNFKKKCMTDSFDFQITNHNYILADLIGQKQGRKPLFPGYGAMVFDESHKLIDAARQMYSTVWDEQDAELIVTLSEANRRTAAMDELTVLRSQLVEYNRQIFDRLAGDLAGNHTREGSRIEIVIGSMEKIYMRHMAKALEQLPLSYQENSGQKMRLQGLKKRCQELTDKLTVFLNSGNAICWMEKRENGRLALCAVPMELEQVLFRDIWSRPIPVIITSGTMSVRGDFSHFKRMTGLSFAVISRIIETSKPSPFDFQSNGLLYIPERMPFPNIRDDRYIQAVMEEILQIVSATHGHTLILFTSYWLMERVFYGLKEQLSDYPLFLMGRGRLDVISSFRRSGNGVLFASDSAGEGIDLAGDILSSLIVVKLPFPVPDPVMEYQRKAIKSPSAYRYEKGIVKNEKMKDVLWKTYAIEDMLRDEVYLGNMVRGKTHSAMHKGEKRHHVPRSEWIVVQGTHEPIVSRELFDAVQAVNEKKAQEHKDNLEKAKENPKRDNLFKGKIFCGDCGITMGGTVGNYNSMSYYCPNYRENGAMGCVKKHISARKLEKAVLEAVQIHLKIFLECREEIRSRNGSAEIGKRRMVLESETRDLRQKEAQYQQKLSSTYLDYKDKLLTVQEYFMLKNKYQAALAELEVARKEKELLLNKMQETYGEDLELSHAAEQYFGQMVVTKDMVDALIERIEVFEKGRIHIIFRFEDEYRSLLEKRADMEQEGAN